MASKKSRRTELKPNSEAIENNEAIGEVDDVPTTQQPPGGGATVHGQPVGIGPSELNSPYMHPEDQNMEMEPVVVGPPSYSSPNPLTSAGRLMPVSEHPLRDYIAEDYGQDVKGATGTVVEGTHAGPPSLTDLESDSISGEATDYENMTVEQLRQLASEREIEGRSSLTTKDELVEALEADDENDDDDSDES